MATIIGEPVSPDLAWARGNCPEPSAADMAKARRKTLLMAIDQMLGASASMTRLLIQTEISMPSGPELDEIRRDYRAAIESIYGLADELHVRLRDPEERKA